MALDDIKSLIIGAIFFVMIIIGGGLFLSSFAASDSTLDTTNRIGALNTQLNKSNDVINATAGIKSSIDIVGSGDVTSLNWFNALFGSIYYSLKASFSSIGFVSAIISDSVSYLGWDAVTPIIALFGLIIIIIIGFAMWSAVTKVN